MLVKNVSYTFGAQITNAALGFVISIYLTRLLGPEGRGMNAIFQNSLGFATLFFGLSINSTIVYFVNSGKIPLQKLLSSLFFFCFFSAFAVLGTLLFLKNFGLLSLVLPEDYQSNKYILLFGLLHFNALLSSILITILTAYKKFKIQSLLSLVPIVLSLLIYIGAYYFWKPADSSAAFGLVLVVTILNALVSLLLSAIYFFKEVRVYPTLSLMDASEIKLMLTFSAMAYAGNILQFFTYRSDFWFIDNYWGKSQLGIYSLAVSLAQLLWLLPNTIAGVLYSYASSATQEEAVRYTVTLTKFTLYASTIAALLEITAFYFGLQFLYGKDFASAFPLIAILSLGIIPFCIPTIISSYYAGRGNFKISFIVSTVSCLFSVTLYLILIPLYGVFGGAIASATAYLSSSIATVIIFNRLTGVPILDFFFFGKDDRTLLLSLAKSFSSKIK